MLYVTHLFFICLYVCDILSFYAIILQYPSTIHRQSIEHTSIYWNATYSIIHMGSRRAVLLDTLILMAYLNLLVILLCLYIPHLYGYGEMESLLMLNALNTLAQSNIRQG